LTQWLKRMRIVHKIILGYILLVFLPVILSGTILYNQFHTNMLRDHSLGKQKLIMQAANSLEGGLAQVESIYSLFQYNSQMLEYLKGVYQSEGDYIYHFLKDIRPVFSFAHNSNPSIQSVRLYKMKPSVMPIHGEIEDLEVADSRYIKRLTADLMMNQGLWLPVSISETNIPRFIYYRYIYSSNYLSKLGLLEVGVDRSIIASFMDTVNVIDNTDMVMVQNNEILYKTKNLQLTTAELHKMINKMGATAAD
jgi:two-component system sensor histidine kinase YesM